MNEQAFLTLNVNVKDAVSVQEMCGCVMRRRTERVRTGFNLLVEFVPCDEHALALGMQDDDNEVDEVPTPDEMKEVELPDTDGPEGYGCASE